MDNFEMKTLFQRHGNGEHPLFRKISVLCHISKGHITAHEDFLSGF